MARGAPAGAAIDPTELMALPGARASILLSTLDPAGMHELLRSAFLVEFAPLDTISSRHAPDDALQVLVRGAGIQQLWAAPGGLEYYARPVAAGEAVGLTDVLSFDPVPRETRALVPTTTVRIPGSAVRGLLRTSPQVAEAVSREAVHVLRASEADQVVLATGDAMARVTQRLLTLVVGWGRPGARGVDIDLPMTQAQLGAWSGVSRETTVKSLQWLRARGLIRTARRHITILDLPELERLAGRRGAGDTVRLRMERGPHGPQE